MDQGDRRRGSVAQLTAATYVSLALGVITGPLTARALGPSGRGELAIATVSATVLTVVAALGLTAAVVHALANHLESESSMLAAAIRYCVIALPACALIGLGAVTGPLSDMSEPGRVGTFAMLATVPLTILGNCLLSILTTRGHLRSLAVMKIVPLALASAALVVLFAFDALTVGAALAVYVSTPFVVLPILWRFVGVRPGRAARLIPLIKFGARGMVGNLAGLTNARLDQLMIVPLLGTAQVGYYALAVSVAQLPLGVSGSVTARAVAALGQNEVGDRDAIAARYLRIVIASSVIACIGLAVVAPFLLPIAYGDDFAPALAPLVFLLPSTVITSVIMMTTGQLTVFGRPGAASIAEVAGVVVTVAGLIAFLETYGIEGAAAVSLVAYAVVASIQLLVLRREGIRGVLPRPADFAAIGRDVLLNMRKLLGLRRRKVSQVS